MKTVVAIVVILLVLAGGAYAIAKHNSSNKSATTNNTSSSNMSHMSSSNQGSKKSGAAPSVTNEVTIDNFAFSPASITVKKGATVSWTNKDSVGHTVTENDGQGGPSSDTIDTGKSYSFSYNAVGTFKYHCSIHPDMTGTVTVTE